MDLKPHSSFNTILKYADDTTLLVPQNSSTTLEAEFSHILDWANENKLKVNTLKTKEIVFHRPRLPNHSPLCFPTFNEQIVPEFLVSIFLPHYPPRNTSIA